MYPNKIGAALEHSPPVCQHLTDRHHCRIVEGSPSAGLAWLLSESYSCTIKDAQEAGTLFVQLIQQGVLSRFVCQRSLL